jgi:predicted O-methyltransferase YrrM
MIIADLSKAKNLLEYKNILTNELKAAHGNDYTEYLDKLIELSVECMSYREIGTWQGSSTATMLVSLIKYVETIDISFEKINPYVDLFKKFAEENEINFVMKEIDSLKNNIDIEVDMLLIDGYHNAKQVQKELNKYSLWTKKFILVHDTTLVPRLQKTINNFLSENKEWTLESQCENNVGYMVIKKC